MTSKTARTPFAPGPQRTFSGEALRTIRFPIGGIGAGCVSLTGRGMLTDWELFNRPNYDTNLLRTFPLLWAREQGAEPQVRVPAAAPQPPYEYDGMLTDLGMGLPHLDSCTFRGEYPFAWLDFECRALPLTVSLEAYNPFIPSEPDDSGYPAAILRYTLTNRARKPLDTVLMWSLYNAVGSVNGQPSKDLGGNVNRVVEQNGLRGLFMTSEKWPADSPRFGSMALTTPNRSVQVMPYWLRADSWKPMEDFLNTFKETGRFPEHDYGPSEDGKSDPGAVGVRMRLKPGETKTATFYFTWFFPNFERYWEQGPPPEEELAANKPSQWKNYYASRFDDALDVAVKLHRNEKRLYERTRAFHGAMHESTVPPLAVEAVSSQLSTLKSPTCLRLEDGTFWGWEGCGKRHGSCYGSCTHVWNYQQALPFLFPSLERSMRAADYRFNTRPDGSSGHRLRLPLGTPPLADQPGAADGQMGGLVKLYRDWKISGDDAWLAEMWPFAKQALEDAWKQWDADRDGVMEGTQHNTYDISFVGPNPLIQSCYLAALEAGARLAEQMGDLEAARSYRGVLQKGRSYVEERLFNGEYYEQPHEEGDPLRNQHGKGCLSDQVFGQWLARVAGIDYTFDPKHVRRALRAIFTYNWKPSLAEHLNPQRIYALHDEAGLPLCTWPKGGRPAFPFIYCDEVWTGVEYQVASHLILEGMVREGMKIVEGVRMRHDGARRNPWNEFECGNHYARAMSSYGLLLAFAGFRYDVGAGMLGFAPRANADAFKTFWAIDGAWGTYEQTAASAGLTVLHGKLTLRRLELEAFHNAKSVRAERKGKAVAADLDGGAVSFQRALTLRAGDAVRLRFRK